MVLPANQAEQYDAHMDVPLPGFIREVLVNVPVTVVPVAHEDHIHLQIGAISFTIDYDGRTITQPVFTFADLGGGTLTTATAWEVLDLEHGQTLLAGRTVIGRLPTQPGATARLAPAAGTIGLGSHPAIHTFLGRDGQPRSLLDDGRLVRFDPETGARVESLNLGIGPVRSAVTGPEPGTLAIASDHGIAIVSTQGAGPLTRAVPRQPHQSFLSLSHDGRFVVVAGPAGPPLPFTVYRRQGEAGDYRALTDFPFTTAVGAGAATGHTGASADAIGVWVPAPPGSPAPLTLHGFRLDTPDAPTLEFSRPASGHAVGDLDPQGRWTVDDNVGARQIHVTDVYTGELVERLPLPPGTAGTEPPSGIRFDSTGDRLLVSSASGRSQLYDTDTWTLIHDETLAGHDIAAGVWNAGGSILATASSTGQITIRDGDTFATIRDMVGAGGSLTAGHGIRLVFSDDDSLLLTDHDNIARVWDVATGQQIGVDMLTAEGTNSGINIGDTLQLITATEDSALIWNLDIESWADLACVTAGSNLTPGEWDQWGPRDEDRQAICEEFPLPS